MGLLGFVFGLLILFAIIFYLIFYRPPPPEKNEELPSFFDDAYQDVLHAEFNNNRQFRNKNVSWLTEADTIKVAANLHVSYATEHGVVIKTDVRVSAYHTKSGLIYGYCDCYAAESTLYTNKINIAIDTESNEDVTDRLRSFLRKNRVRDSDVINKR